MNETEELSRESILKALEVIDEDPELRNGRKSTTYDLVYEGKAYPPILVLSEANKVEGGNELTLRDFQNDTTSAFKKLKNFGFKVEEKGESFKQILKKIGKQNGRKYFSLLRDLIEKLNINEDDERVVFSIRPDQNRLAFTIGQRYCFTVQKKNKVEWGFITSEEKDELRKSIYDGSVLAYWNETELIQDVEKFYDDIVTACHVELDRTNKSSFRNHNSPEFEESVFNKNHLMELFDNIDEVTEEKETFVETLNKFLEQAKTNDLTYSHYRDNYNGLNVRVSFGKGNQARIPWISFLHDSQSTNEGIYPVYLLFKDRNVLVLAYGISEENDPQYEWPLDNPITIKKYFQENNLGNPQRYGASYVYKVYDLNKSLKDYSIDSDLYELTNFYKKIFDSAVSRTEELKFDIKRLNTDLNHSNLIYDSNLVQRFASGIISKPFLILTGLSGSGKTKLAQAFSKWIIEEDKQLNLVPVGADWTNREPLLGYPNALEEGKYVLPESGVLQLILRAANERERPYFLILDEMNLSHVERYFADFLSAIESKEEIKLHSGDKNYSANGYEIPSSITIPKNLFIIGTVNIDETTYMFSPKVLDRANVIEFRVKREELAQFLENPADVDLDILRNQGASMAKDFVNMAKDNEYSFSQKETLSEELLKFFKELNSVGAEFGYRSAYEIQRFAGLAEQLSDGWEFEQIMDAAIAQKLLPKLHGSRRKLEKVLFRLGDLCYPSLEKGCDDLFKKHDDISEEVIKRAKYPISFEKIARMHKGLVENGFTSFAEA